MQAGQFAKALTEAEKMTSIENSEEHLDVKLAENNPKSQKYVEGLYLQAVCARYLKKYDLAANSLQELRAVAPDFGRGLQEYAHLARDEGRLNDAVTAYRQAVRANPGLTASWKSLAAILQRQGQTQQARQAKSQAERLAALPPTLLAATNLIYENKTVKAENLVRGFLQKNPHHIEAMRLLAEIAMRFGVFDEADFLLESAIEFSPDDIQIKFDYIQVLRKRQKFAAALEQAQALYERDPNNPTFQSYLAIESMQTGQHERAFELVSQT